MIKAVIFDLFGTLAESSCNPEEKIRKEFKLEHDYSLVEKLVCGTEFRNFDNYIQAIMNGVNIPNTSRNIKRITNIFNIDVLNAKLLPETRKVVHALKKRGCKLGVISNIPNPKYDVLAKEGVQSMFNSIVYSYECGLIKPDPAIFQLALKQLGIKPHEAIMIGDSVKSDIEGASALGLQTLLIDHRNKYLNHNGSRVNSLEKVPEYISSQI
ncbi:TPA: HAD family hydrolase [Candidatus Woesearchaeota archaeon]|nr:HAD family hydrolase [Candidatus Woesearchaeota archaeon]HIH39499.1 HAD family hydrolase [Candidatus Woesearchaeota archaeon]